MRRMPSWKHSHQNQSFFPPRKKRKREKKKKAVSAFFGFICFRCELVPHRKRRFYKSLPVCCRWVKSSGEQRGWRRAEARGWRRSSHSALLSSVACCLHTLCPGSESPLRQAGESESHVCTGSSPIERIKIK